MEEQHNKEYSVFCMVSFILQIYLVPISKDVKDIDVVTSIYPDRIY